MSTIKLSLNDADYNKLKTDADNKGMTVQDYIRYELCNRKTIFTVKEAIRRFQAGNFKDKEFTLPDLYGTDWTLKRGRAGVFGKNFYNYIEDNPELGIRFKGICSIERRAKYIYIKGK